MIEDVLSACRWIVENPSGRGQTAPRDDTQQTLGVVFAGVSAGGWCALVAALHFCVLSQNQQPRADEPHVSPARLRPKALLLLYPMLCLSNPRWCQPIFTAPEPMCDITVQEHLASADQRIRDRQISLGEPFTT